MEPNLLAESLSSPEHRLDEPACTTSESFLKLAAPYKRKLLGYIFKNLNHSDDANDVYQETLFRAFRYFKSFDTDRAFRPWLFSIAYNEINRHHKKINRLRFLPLLDEKSIPDKINQGPLVRGILRSAENLNYKQRRVFFLFHLIGFRVSEIAETLGQRESTVSTILSRARINLRDKMEQGN